jgi:hypothetical protein
MDTLVYKVTNQETEKLTRQLKGLLMSVKQTIYRNGKGIGYFQSSGTYGPDSFSWDKSDTANGRAC